MVYSSSYTPTYYSSLHESITSICKNILPFSFKKRRLPAIAAAEQRLSKQQSDNLKWQQDSYHQILNLMGLCKEGILHENEVSAFRGHLLETLIASPFDHEPPLILRDKLIFLQELLYAKCISDDEYHASKRPLLQRLAVQGAEIGAKDVIVGVQKEVSNEEWSVIDLKDEKISVNQENSTSKKRLKENSTIKKMRGAASVLGFVTPDKNGKLREENIVNDRTSKFARNELLCSTENPFWNSHLYEKESDSKSILMKESLPMAEKSVGEKAKTKPFRTLFSNGGKNPEEKEKVKSGKKAWGFDGFKKWKKDDCEDETVPLSLGEKSDGEIYPGQLVDNPVGEGSDTKQIKRKLHPNGAPSDFFVDKVLGENIKKELFRIQAEFARKNPNVHLSDDQIEEISTRLPVDKADLIKVFPKSWCDEYGDVVLDVVRKEFKNHVGEMGNSRVKAEEKQNSKRWTTFDDDYDENSHPNLFASSDHSYSMKQGSFSSSKNAFRSSFNSSSIDKGFKYNPFFDM
ncbi:hypothetical protein BUALT_Bualt16G0079800 [Buddleja alternifolia]|uniref:Uncharacterized protein n=1 Tax=Buddleja alternifolia TaxID=168488 RepID=A0AAV6WA37_9LAMI|nr:hypothetical protein BUALT_Bualt16G0079800 [Buddleja alternifolia]